MSERPRRAAYREQGPPNGPSNAELREAKRIELQAQLAALDNEHEHADAWGETDTPYYGTGERTDLQGYYDWQNARTPLDGEADLFNNFDANGNLKPEAARPEYADLSLTQLAKEGRRLKEMNDKAGIDEVWNALQDKLVEKATAQDWTEKQMFDQLDRYEAMLFTPKSEVAVPTPTASPTEVTPPAPAPDETDPTDVDPRSLEVRLLTPENKKIYDARVKDYQDNPDKRPQLRADAWEAVNTEREHHLGGGYFTDYIISSAALDAYDEIDAKEASNGGGSKDATVEPEPVVVTDPEVIVIDPDETEPVVTEPGETDPLVDPEPTPDPTPTEPAPAPASSEVTPPEEPAKPEVQKGSEGFAFSSEDLTPAKAEAEVMTYIGQADPADRVVAYGTACSEFVKYGMARHWNVGEMTLARNRMDEYYKALTKDSPVPQGSEAASATPATPTSEEVTPAVVPKRRLAPSRAQQAEQAVSGAAEAPKDHEGLDSLVDQLIEAVRQASLEDRLGVIERAEGTLSDAQAMEGWDETRYTEGLKRFRDATADMPMVLPVIPPAGGEAAPAADDDVSVVVPKRRLFTKHEGSGQTVEQTNEELDARVSNVVAEMTAELQASSPDKLKATRRKAINRLWRHQFLEGWDAGRYLAATRRIHQVYDELSMAAPVAPVSGNEVVAAAAATPDEEGVIEELGEPDEEEAYGERDPVRILGKKFGKWVAGTTLGYYGWQAKNYLGKTLSGSRTASPKTDAQGRELR